MFKLVRYYFVVSLVAVLATLLLLAWFYRQVAIQGIVELTERNNLTLARTALSSMKPDLLDFLRATEHLQPDQPAYPPLPPQLAEPIRNLMFERAVVRVKLYNHRGIVVYSSRHEQIGSDQGRNQGFAMAVSGQVVNSLIYRDTFNRLDGATENDNMMQTYLPIRASPADPTLGVFEIYTDINHLAQQTERTEFIIIFGALIILTATYFAVGFGMWRAGKIIEQQQRTIHERTQTLEALSAQMLRGEESNKKRIAHELHEGLAQTLSAIKLYVENLRARNPKGDADPQTLGAIIPVLRDAIEDVRNIATELRPSSIDDIGLLQTLDSHLREVEQLHPPIQIELEAGLTEQDIPARLKIILYRIVASVLNDMVRYSNNGTINLGLWRKDNDLTLMIDDTAVDALDLTAIPLSHIDPTQRAGFARMEELTTLSGGEFRASRHAKGGATLHATWHVPDVAAA